MPNTRSLLIVPAHRLSDAAADSAADVVVLDLEAGVPESDKAAAREALRPAAEKLKAAGKQVHVRLNPLDSGHTAADLQAAIGPDLDGIILANTSAAHQVREVDVLIREQELRREVRPGTARLFPQIASAAGLLRCEDIILASTRIGGLSLESEPYCVDLGIARSRGGHELDFARATIVNCCVAYRAQPLDGIFPFADDLTGLAQEAEHIRSLGLAGKYIAAPEHAEIANQVFPG